MNRREKEGLVRSNRAHAALVYDGADVVGWCQFGSPNELPARMAVYDRLGVASPDWRITCFFADRDRRGEGIARAGLAGALRIIAAEGGGTVDGYPTVVHGGRTSNSVLWRGTASMFDDAGFRRLGAVGPASALMRKTVRRRRARPRAGPNRAG